CGEVLGDAADGGGVGAGVVVEDHDGAGTAVGGEFVEGFESHPAGERAVADHRDRDGRAACEPVCAVQPVGPGDRARGMGVLDQVVLGLASVRVPGGAPGGAQSGQVGTAGEHLV